MRVSVILPTYNCRQWLPQAVESILRQTFGDFELLIVDDGSTDGTADIVAAFTDPRIRYLRKPNGGAASARNFGLDHAAGEFIAFLDADDAWPEEFLAAMLAAIERARDCRGAYAPLVNVHPDGRRRVPRRFRHAASGQVTWPLFRHGFIFLVAMVVRREAFEGLRFDESLATNSDTDLVLRLSRRVGFAAVPDVQVTRHIRPGSLTHQGRHHRLNLNVIRVLERFYFRLGGDRDIPRHKALRYLGHCYGVAAREFLRAGARRAARHLFRRCLAHDPLSPRAILGLLRCVFSRAPDTMPDWHEPPPLPLPPGTPQEPPP